MGRRSRKRTTERVAPPPPREAPVAPRAAPHAATYKSRREEAPKPAWAPFPLTELCILVGMILLALGFFTSWSNHRLLGAMGVVLIALAAGELSLREHFAGYRSHTSLIAGAAAVIALTVLRVANAPSALVLPVAIIVFGAVFFAMRRAFMRRSGGVGFRA